MTNYLETITNGTNIYRVYEVITDVVITNTKWVTETNTVTNPSDPALWITGFAALATVITAFIMRYSVRKMAEQNIMSNKSVQEMKKQNEQSYNNSIIMTLIQYDQQIISTSNDLLQSLRGTGIDFDISCGALEKLKNILNHVIIIYYSKLCENNNYLKYFFNELINPTIENTMEYIEEYRDVFWSRIVFTDKIFLEYCEEQNINIPEGFKEGFK